MLQLWRQRFVSDLARVRFNGACYTRFCIEGVRAHSEPFVYSLWCIVMLTARSEALRDILILWKRKKCVTISDSINWYLIFACCLLDDFVNWLSLQQRQLFSNFIKHALFQYFNPIVKTASTIYRQWILCTTFLCNRDKTAEPVGVLNAALKQSCRFFHTRCWQPVKGLTDRLIVLTPGLQLWSQLLNLRLYNMVVWGFYCNFKNSERWCTVVWSKGCLSQAGNVMRVIPKWEKYKIISWL